MTVIKYLQIDMIHKHIYVSYIIILKIVNQLAQKPHLFLVILNHFYYILNIFIIFLILIQTKIWGYFLLSLFIYLLIYIFVEYSVLIMNFSALLRYN